MTTIADALGSLARLAAAAAAIAWDGARSDDVPRSLARVDSAWLGRVLAPHVAGGEIEAIEVLDAHAGTTARGRIALHWRGGRPSDGAPQSVFVKLAPAALANRLFVTVAGLGRSEVGFYRDLRPDLPVRAPTVYDARSTTSGSAFALVLEDLERGGARFARVGDAVTLEQAECVMEALARLHAHYWESPRLREELGWVPRWEVRRRRDMRWERFVTGQMIGVATRRFSDDFAEGELARIGAAVTRRRDALEALLARGDRTLVHGDCHVGNLFFEGASVGFYDWQVCALAPGMRDVGYFLCNSLPARLRARHERALVERYLAALRDRGAPAPAFEAAFEQHRLYALYAFIAAAFTAAAGDALQPLEVGLAGLRRAVTAVGELESLDCAATLGA